MASESSLSMIRFARTIPAAIIALGVTAIDAGAAAIDIPCVDSNSSSEAPGLLSKCSDVANELIQGTDGKGGLRALAKGHISRLYAGKLAQHSKAQDANHDGSLEESEIPMKAMPVPVCAPIVGSLVFELGKETGHPMVEELATNHLGQSCGEYLEVEVKGSLTNVQVAPVRDRNNPVTGSGGRTRGQRERAFIQSLRVLAVEEAYATLTEEIRNGRKFTMQAGTEPLVSNVTDQQKTLTSAAKDLGKDALAQKEIQRCEKSKNTAQGDGTYQVNSIQQKAQQLCSAWKLSQATVFQLAAAELFERAGAYYRRAMEDGTGGVVERAISEIGDACESRAKSAAKDKPLKWKQEAGRAATQCYQEKAGPFIQKELRKLFPHVKAEIPLLSLLFSLLTLPFGGGRSRRRKEDRITLGDVALITGFTLTLSACAGSCRTCDDTAESNIHPSTLEAIARCHWDDNSKSFTGGHTNSGDGYYMGIYFCDTDTTENNDGDPKFSAGEVETYYCTLAEAQSACASFKGDCAGRPTSVSEDHPVCSALYPSAPLGFDAKKSEVANHFALEIDPKESLTTPDGVIAEYISLIDSKSMNEARIALCGSTDCKDVDDINPSASYSACADQVRDIPGMEDASAEQIAQCCTAQGESDSQSTATSKNKVRWCTFQLNDSCMPDSDPSATDDEAGSHYVAAFANLAGAQQSMENAGLLASDKKDTKAEEVGDLADTSGNTEAATAATKTSSRTGSTSGNLGDTPTPGAFQGSGSGGTGSNSGASGFSLGGGSTAAYGEASAAQGALAASDGSGVGRLTGGGNPSAGTGRGMFGSGDGGTLSVTGGGMNFGGEPSATGDVPAMGSEDPDDYFTRTELEENLFKMVEKKLDEKERGWILKEQQAPASK